MNQEKDKPKKFTDREIFEIALKSRDFEIKMFWQRCNYFLLLNTSVGAAVGAAVVSNNVTGKNLFFIIFCLCIIGMFVCLAWIKVGLGAKFWQVYWEQVVSGLQKKVGLLEENSSEKNNIFGKYEDIKWRAEKGLEEKKNTWYYEKVLAKPSVSGWMHKTACFFLGVWVLTFIYISLCLVFCSFCHAN